MSFEDIPSAFDNVRVPPHSLPAEQGVLGCILLSPRECTSICLDKLKGGAESFYGLNHQTIYEALVQMHDGRKPVDIITLQQHLKDLGKLDEVGGLVYLSELMNVTPSSANLEYYLRILDEKWKARKLIEMAGEATAKAYSSEGEEIDQTIDRLASWAVKTGMAAAQGERVIKEVLMGLVHQFNQERKGIFDDIIPTGLTDYDRRFRGLVLQELCILAGRPSTGKTASALQVALNVLRAGTPVGIVSLEMTAESLLRRMAGAAAGLEMQSVQYFTDNQMVKLTAAMMRIKEMPLSIHDQAGLTVRQIQSIVRGWVQKNKVKVVIIDYLQLVVGSSKRGKDDRTLEVAEISLALKQLAKELNVAMLVLAQLNRDVERRGGRPRLSDLKESGAIEQDADQVIFLWYGKEEDEETKENLMKQIDQPKKNRPVITFTVAKKRNGATGDVSMIFEKDTQRFLPMTNDFSESYATHPQ